jgi:hypothetical protein
MSRQARALAALLALFGFVGSTAGAAAAANSNASCNGILVSSLAGGPGELAEATRAFHEAFKDAGIPPGFFDVAGAQEHAGSVEECLEALTP